MSMRRLPPVNVRNRGRALMIGYGLFCVLYLGSYLLSHTRATLLPAGYVDALFPVLPGTLWLYLSQFLLLPLAFLLEHRSARLTQTFYAMIAATLFSCIVFIVWPTSVGQTIRADDLLTGTGWRWLYFFDVPGNCFPSLHVALSLLAAHLLAGRGRVWGVLAPLWAVAIAVSVITTRQHRVIDIGGGVIVAVAGFWMSRRLLAASRAGKQPELIEEQA